MPVPYTYDFSFLTGSGFDEDVNTVEYQFTFTANVAQADLESALHNVFNDKFINFVEVIVDGPADANADTSETETDADEGAGALACVFSSSQALPHRARGARDPIAFS